MRVARAISRRGHVPIANRHLLAERIRLAISILGVAFATVLAIVVLSLFRGWSTIGGIFSELPGEVWIAQAGTTDPFYTTSILADDADLIAELETTEGIAATIPIRARQLGFEHEGGTGRIFLLSLGSPRTAAVDARTVERFLPAPGEIVLDQTLADETNIRVGDTVTLNGVRLAVSAITPGGNAVITQFGFVNWADSAAIFAPVANSSYLLVQPAREVSAQELRSELQARFPQTLVFTSDEFAQTVADLIDETFLPVVTVVLALGLVIGAAVVGLTIYTATVERRREYAILKAVGATPRQLTRVVLTQSLLLTVLGFAVGAPSAVGTALLAEWIVPEFLTDLRPTDLLVVFLALLVLSLVAALLPIRKVARVDPASVFNA